MENWTDHDALPLKGSVEDGWLSTPCTPMSVRWNQKILQEYVPVKDAKTRYVVKFKVYASVDMVVPFVQEDKANSWNKTVLTS